MSKNTWLEIKVVGWFTLNLILFTIGFQVLFGLAAVYLGTPEPTGSSNALIAMMMPMVAGNFYYKRTGSIPARRRGQSGSQIT